MVYKNTEVVLKKSTYTSNNTLAVLMFDAKTNEYLGTITTNISASDIVGDNTTAFVDINNFPGITEMLENSEIAFNTGIKAQSGFCTYPLYVFDISQIADKF